MSINCYFNSLLKAFIISITIISFVSFDLNSNRLKAETEFVKIGNKNYKKLNFKERGSRFFGIIENGKMIKGIYKGKKTKNGNQSTWYGTFTEKTQEFKKGYFHHKYGDGMELYQYMEYEVENGKVVMEDDKKTFKMVDHYLVTEEDFKNVKQWIQTDMEMPFSFGGFEDFKKENTLIAKKKSNISSEKYFALVIGNNNYQHLDKLIAAKNDATAISKILEQKYGFEVSLLLNANYDQTVNTIYSITKKLTPNDNLLIYYAGHGELDEDENRGYWLPIDANEELRSKWISNSFIVDRIKATKAKHVLLMVDSCFSGTLLRSGTTGIDKTSIDKKYIQRLKNKKTRLVITSGGNEPVVDNTGDNHSLFAFKLLETLKNNNNVINSQVLFENIRNYVVSNASQTPEIAIVHKSGHDGGDFLFFSN